MKIKVIQGDITTLAVDAIVNAANQVMLGGGGVDGAIHRAAGRELYEACLKVPEMRPGVRCPTGEARITPGFKLPAKFVIHTVGPVYRDGQHGEPEKLAACYRNSLALAAENGCKSIAFPCISTGVYGYPKEEAAQIAVREVEKFLTPRRGEAESAEMEVIFCCFSEWDKKVYEYQMLLTGVGNIINGQNYKVARGEYFNVFSLCGVNHYEVWHSKILAEFLNPHGSHGQKDLFLRLFASIFLNKDNNTFSDATTVSTEVTSYIKDLRIGRFDILIEDTKNRCVCIIENKIFAGEQPEQLSRYLEWLRNERDGWTSSLVFLTLDGHKSATIEGEESYIKLPYWKGNDDACIASWIGECANKVMELIKAGQNGLQHLYSALEQYKIHIENIAKGEMVMNEEIVNILQCDMASAQAIFDNYRAACLKCANDILVNQVLNKLNSNIKNDEGRWAVEGSCNFNKGQEGVRYFRESKDPGDAEAEYGHIYVIFEATHLSQCEVAIWQNSASDSNIINLERGMDDKIVGSLRADKDNLWTVTYGKVNWPVWRGVRDPDDSVPRDLSYAGMDWDGKFFMRMKSNSDYRRKVIDDIAKSILELYKFQEEYRKSHPFS